MFTFIKKNIFEVPAFFIAFSAFLYLRLSPLFLHTVPYTYDQGRDFLKAQEIVRDHKMTLIGPTTGINGLFHGAWWYYLLSVPYSMFRGLPIGFYLFLFVLVTGVTLAAYVFLRKHFSPFIAVLFLAIVAVSPYFIPTSFQAANNYIVPLLLCLLIACLRAYIDRPRLLYFFLIALLLGFVFEFEVAFGIFIIPSFFLTALFFREFRSAILKWRYVMCGFVGLIIPFLPRILFDLKHQFLQSKTILNFVLKPKLYNPKPFDTILHDRIAMFRDYYKNIFIGGNDIIAVFFIGLAIVGIALGFRALKTTQKKVALFVFLLLGLLFGISLLYKDNFWANYYEGIPYVFLFVLFSGIFAFSKIKQLWFVLPLIVILYLAVDVASVFTYYKSGKTADIGLRRTENAVDYILKHSHSNDLCVRVYTPPVLTYTYDYIFSYTTHKEGKAMPKTEWVNNTCWFVIESDAYAFRLKQWTKNNIPEKGTLIESKKFGPELIIEEWKNN